MADQATFYIRDLQWFEAVASSSYSGLLRLYHHANQKVHDGNEQLVIWVTNRHRRVLLLASVLVLVALAVLFINEAVSRDIGQDSLQVIIGGLICGPVLGLVASIIGGGLIYLALGLADLLVVRLIYTLIVLGLTALALFGGVILIASFIFRLILLIPLPLVLIYSAVSMLWQNIFLSCPNPTCSVRHVGIYKRTPVYSCDQCNKPHADLWPGLRGVFFHRCEYCNNSLPTLGLWGRGRNRLERRCRVCNTPIPSGTQPEERIALVGGPSAGKTTFLLEAARQLASADLNAHPIVSEQGKELKQGWTNLDQGILPDPTQDSITYLFTLSRPKRKTTLYFIDPPGYKFATIHDFEEQESIRYLDGLLLLVDPFTLPGLGHHAASFRDVVAATIATASRLRRSSGRRKSMVPLAVILTKADLPPIAAEIGDIKTQTPKRYRDALLKWQAGNEVRILEVYFQYVYYFACSSLQYPKGVLEPVLHILNHKNNTSSKKGL